MLSGEYLIADPVWCDSLDRADDRQSRYATALQVPPSGWARTEFDCWVAWQPDRVELPDEGWKIHVSACLDEAERVIAAVRDYCVDHDMPFKFLRSRLVHFVRNEKYAPRSASGKLCAIYPADEAQLEQSLRELGAALAGCRGPYVLSDLRWERGPLYVRYGGFRARYCVHPDTDELVPAIQDADGVLVPDVRGPIFSVPPWVAVPGLIARQQDVIAAQAKVKLPYRVERALHFSNGGGVYRATDPATGRTVVLREGRPHAGLDVHENDATSRLAQERAVLKRLAGLDVVPALIDHFMCWEHEYLVEEYIEGDLLQQAIGQRYPLIYPGASADQLSSYTSWALDMLAAIECAVAAVHERGIVYGDLHPHNIIVRHDGRVTLVDFEQSFEVGEQHGSSLGAPGFVAPWPLTSTQVDEYAMNCLRLAFFLPLTFLLALDPGKAPQLVDAAASMFPLPAEFTDKLLRGFAPPDDWDERAWRAKRPGLCRSAGAVGTMSGTAKPDPQAWLSSMTEAILASATPERTDRLFPGDIEQFAEAGVSVAHGAAGVLYALAATGRPTLPEHVDWLARAARRWEPAMPGLFGGLHGVAVVLAMLGRTDDAIQIATMAAGLRWQPRQVGLYRGLAGVGLACLHLGAATGCESFDDDARRIGQRLLASVAGESSAGTIDPSRPGLLHGWSGVAAFLIRLYEQTQDPDYLVAAEITIRRDLACCVTTRSGGLQVEVPPRLLLYLADGSSGIGLALSDLLSYRPDAELAKAADQIRVDLDAEFAVFPGLFGGRAGLLLASALVGRQPGTLPPATVEHHLRRLAWHALSYQGHLAFPGNGLLRLSMDLATGTAGIAYACHCALQPQDAAFPFLGGNARAADPACSPEPERR